RTAARGEVEPLVVMVAPFAPHLAEELWEGLGHEGSIFDAAPWPSYDAEKARESTVEVAVQVNGKLRATIQLPADASAQDAEAAAREQENVLRYLEGAAVRKVIHVPNRLLNFVVG
ncbi:MAG TPA: class I tRNA ligase family protein, partial [Longimicrobiales bacterium]|nr:class I tRNA ligase family protein [Longimicrobiales bacterium]